MKRVAVGAAIGLVLVVVGVIGIAVARSGSGTTVSAPDGGGDVDLWRELGGGVGDGILLIDGLDEALPSANSNNLVVRGDVVGVAEGVTYTGQGDEVSSEAVPFGEGVGLDWVHVRVDVSESFGARDDTANIIRIEVPSNTLDVAALDDAASGEIVAFLYPFDELLSEFASFYERFDEPVYRLVVDALFTDEPRRDNGGELVADVRGFDAPFLDFAADELLGNAVAAEPDHRLDNLDELWSWISAKEG